MDVLGRDAVERHVAVYRTVVDGQVEARRSCLRPRRDRGGADDGSIGRTQLDANRSTSLSGTLPWAAATKAAAARAARDRRSCRPRRARPRAPGRLETEKSAYLRMASGSASTVPRRRRRRGRVVRLVGRQGLEEPHAPSTVDVEEADAVHLHAPKACVEVVRTAASPSGDRPPRRTARPGGARTRARRPSPRRCRCRVVPHARRERRVERTELAVEGVPRMDARRLPATAPETAARGREEEVLLTAAHRATHAPSVTQNSSWRTAAVQGGSAENPARGQ